MSGPEVQGIATSKGQNCRRIRLAGSAVTALTVGSLLFAAGAFAQGALDQYSPATRPAPGQGGGSAVGSESVPGAALGPAASDASAAGGAAELPFTGYPLTPLIIALLILLATGVMLRVGVEVHSRLSGRD